jgi:hypothetical protein
MSETGDEPYHERTANGNSRIVVLIKNFRFELISQLEQFNPHVIGSLHERNSDAWANGFGLHDEGRAATFEFGCRFIQVINSQLRMIKANIGLGRSYSKQLDLDGAASPLILIFFCSSLSFSSTRLHISRWPL